MLPGRLLLEANDADSGGVAAIARSLALGLGLLLSDFRGRGWTARGLCTGSVLTGHPEADDKEVGVAAVGLARELPIPQRQQLPAPASQLAVLS